MSSLVVKVLTLTGVEFELTLQQPAASSNSSAFPSAAHPRASTSSSAPFAPFRVSDVKRLLPFPARCTTLLHRGAAASDERTLTSLRVSEPFVVILDKAEWRASLEEGATTTATASNKRALPSYYRHGSAEDEEAAAAAMGVSYDSADGSSDHHAQHTHKRSRRTHVGAVGGSGSGCGGGELSDDARRFEQLEEAMRRRRERRYQPIVITAPHPPPRAAAAEGKEQEAKHGDDSSSNSRAHEPVADPGDWSQLSGYRARRQHYTYHSHQQQQHGSGEGVGDADGSSGSGGAGASSVSSRLRSSIARVEQLKDARDRLVQLQQRSRQQQQEQHEHQPPQQQSSTVPPPLPPRPSSRLSAASSSSSVVRVALQQLEGMGFPSQSAEQALKRCGGNLSDAIELLMMHNDNRQYIGGGYPCGDRTSERADHP